MQCSKAVLRLIWFCSAVFVAKRMVQLKSNKSARWCCVGSEPNLPEMTASVQWWVSPETAKAVVDQV